EDEIIAYIDKEKIEKIITNLLSNAFKFTPEEGEIEITTSLKLPSIPPLVMDDLNEGFVKISIRDNGIGIPKENISKIFDRFYQVDGGHKREQEGTGIGLSLAKELIELHKGTIEVESEEGKGSVFTISIPLSKEHLMPEQICDTKQFEPTHSSIEPNLIDEDKLEKPGLEQLIETEKSILLIVEDNYDVRNYIKDNLKNDYKIIEAINGQDGWNKSIESALGGPDLIISDVMMPKMDGFELCRKLKTDERTSHIPVILLTAKASSQDKIEGFETGADEYIMKPFEPDELNARIKNLIEQRKRIHEHFKKHGIYRLEESKINSADKKFLKKVFCAIMDNMSNPTFNVVTLSELVAVSRSVLHKKIVSLIGEPPVEVIRRIRVSRGAELIEKKFGNISEIALEVGFNNPAHFSEYFKKQFGVTPSQYLHKI
ncbi:MAG: ATP-binding protein, partial [Ignavibacteriaceae bacterium]